MGADGTTFRPTYTSDPAGREDFEGSERTGGDPHTDIVGVETTTQPSGGYENYL